jgi:hypothetical protein
VQISECFMRIFWLMHSLDDGLCGHCPAAPGCAWMRIKGCNVEPTAVGHEMAGIIAPHRRSTSSTLQIDQQSIAAPISALAK